MSKVRCEAWGGTRVVVRQEPAPIFGCKLTSATRTVAMRYFCGECRGRGWVEGPDDPAPAPAAPSEAFDRAMARAHRDGLTFAPAGRAGAKVVTNRANGHRYVTGREGCSCPAGSRGQLCKHRAALLARLAGHKPALTRKAVAA